MRGQLQRTEVLAPLSMWRLSFSGRQLPEAACVEWESTGAGRTFLCSVSSLIPTGVVYGHVVASQMSHMRARTEAARKGAVFYAEVSICHRWRGFLGW